MDIVFTDYLFLSPPPRRYVDISGDGYLGGDFPDYVTKVEGTPTQTEILIFLRREIGQPDNGRLIKHLITFESGSWRVDNLNPDLRYDVVCRYPGYKDEIMSNIQPFVE